MTLGTVAQGIVGAAGGGEPMPIKQLARSKDELVTAPRDATVRELARLMDENTVGCVVIEGYEQAELVMTKRGPRRKQGKQELSGEPVGIVTDRDLTVDVLAADRDPDAMTAADVMQEDLVTVGPNASAFDLCTTMCEHEVRRVPVVDNDQLVGIITMDDVLVLIESELSNISTIATDLAGVIDAESPPLSIR
jgi:CBS domain-containing protein